MGSKQSGKPRKSGWVYILTNQSMPGLLKIGCTGDTPEGRAAKLSGRTGVPTPFQVAWAHPVSDWYAVEQATHDRLSDCRPNASREFFQCSVSEARRAIERAARAYMRPAWLRFLIGPHRRRRGRPARQGRAGHQTAYFRVVGLLAVACLCLYVVALKPDLSRLPDGQVTRALLFLEGRHR